MSERQVVEVRYLSPNDNNGGQTWRERQAYFQPSRPDYKVTLDIDSTVRLVTVQEVKVNESGDAVSVVSIQGFPMDKVVTYRVYMVDIPFRDVEDAR